ncbi:MAG: ATPase [Crocinitomicaceae bacterium]|nr:ATPase [Crocinitomicaceae bacterium]
MSTITPPSPYVMKDGARYYNFKSSCIYLNYLGKKIYGTNFRLYPADKEVLYKLLIYTVGDKEHCSKHGIDLNKGILLNGPVGCGKTTLMNLLRYMQDPNTQYLIKSTRDIATEFNKEGYSTINKYGKAHKIYCFDDLGIENNMKHYGNECNTIGEILLHRYDLLIHEGIITHATTNLNAVELEKLYGNRVRSRLRSMFNLVAFEKGSEDKRK